MTPWLVARARESPRAPAVETSDARLGCAELVQRSDRVARCLAARGVRGGDRVAVLGEPTLRTVEIVHAVQRLGAVLVPVGTRLAAPEVRALLEFSRPRLVLHDARHARLAGADSIEIQAGLDATALAPASVLREANGDEPHPRPSRSEKVRKIVASTEPKVAVCGILWFIREASRPRRAGDSMDAPSSRQAPFLDGVPAAPGEEPGAFAS